MRMRYCIEIKDAPPAECCFAYFDTEEFLARHLFEYEKIDLSVDEVYGTDDDPYLIIECRFPREQRAAFLHAIDMLPSLMAYAGKTDYDDYCRDRMMKAMQFMQAVPMSGSTLIQ